MKQASEKVTITAKVDKVRYEKDGFVIFGITNKKNKKTMGAKGIVLESVSRYVGQVVVFTGTLDITPHGEQINFEHCAIEEGAEYFWRSVAKIPQKSLKNIVTRFGSDPSWLDEERNYVLNRLATVPGIGTKTIRRIFKNWEEYQSVRRLMELVSIYGIPQSQAVKIHRHFGDDSVKVMTTEPYKLTEVSGFGFRKADEIAAKVGVSETSTERIIAAVAFILNQFAGQGSTVVHETEVMNQLNALVTFQHVERKAVASLEELGWIIEDAGKVLDNPPTYVRQHYVCFEAFLTMDRYLYEYAKSQSAGKLVVTHDKAVSFLGEQESFKALGDEQKLAVTLCFTSPHTVLISGYAGSGKTTTSKASLNLMCQYFSIGREDVVCCALSGVAASRIKSQSGFSANTIHALLGINESGEWLYNEDNKLPHRVVLLDEAGMVDTHLFFSLVKAIDFSRTKFIVMGDPAQVAPVGAGQPFKDLIEMNLLPHQELTKIYRQSEDQAIAWIASQIRAGVRPVMKQSYQDVFSYRAKGSDNAQTNQSIEEKIALLAQRFKVDVDLTDPKSVLNYLYHFQVITPRRTGVLGQEELSPVIRRTWLSCEADSQASEEDTSVVIKDKMIHLKNTDMKTTSNQPVKVFNGMIGVVESVDHEEDSFVVHFPIEGIKVIYSMKHIRNGTIGYAWALTIHKTQGSEYQNVVIPFSRSHWNMLNNRLTYTAVTRAKSSCHLVGDVGAFSHACTSADAMKRDTVLQIMAL